MIAINRSLVVPFSPRQMYNLVNSIEKYADFLPWCRDVKVLERQNDWVRATIHIAKGPLQHKFTTKNTLHYPDKIEIELADGPFEMLQGCWSFIAENSTSSRVNLDLNFKFANKLYELTLGSIMPLATDKLIDAFRSQAYKEYTKYE